MNEKSSMKRRYRSFFIMVVCWVVFLNISVFFADYYRQSIVAFFIFAGGSILSGIFLIVKSMGFKCPKCNKRFDVRSRPRFCPHCGSSLE